MSQQPARMIFVYAEGWATDRNNATDKEVLSSAAWFLSVGKIFLLRKNPHA